MAAPWCSSASRMPLPPGCTAPRSPCTACSGATRLRRWPAARRRHPALVRLSALPQGRSGCTGPCAPGAHPAMHGHCSVWTASLFCWAPSCQLTLQGARSAAAVCSGGHCVEPGVCRRLPGPLLPRPARADLLAGRAHAAADHAVAQVGCLGWEGLFVCVCGGAKPASPCTSSV